MFSGKPALGNFFVPGIILAMSTLVIAQEPEMGPEELVKRHLEAIGIPKARTRVKSRLLDGRGEVKLLRGRKMIQTSSGQTSSGGQPTVETPRVIDAGLASVVGPATLVSEGEKILLSIRFNDLNYPEERLSFDGRKVRIDYINFEHRSTLGEFLHTNNRLVKEGLIGGVLSTAWPLLDLKVRKPRLKFNGRQTVDGRSLLELEYQPNKNWGDVETKLYFDESFRHVGTIHQIRRAPQARTFEDARRMVDEYYQLEEWFSDFRVSDGLNLPMNWTIRYSIESNQVSYLAKWEVSYDQVTHNVSIEPELFGSRHVPDEPPGLYPGTGAESAGTATSLTALSAPRKARKAYQKARKELGKKEPNPSKAVKELDKALKRYPEFAEAWDLLGRIRVMSRDHPGAREAFEKAVAAEPNYVNPYLSLARLCLIEKHWEEAAQLSGRVLRLIPDSSYAYYCQSLSNYYLGNLDTAEKSARKVLISDATGYYPQMHYLLGMILGRKRDLPSSATEFRRYIELSPDAPEVRGLKKRLQELETAGLIKKPPGEGELASILRAHQLWDGTGGKEGQRADLSSAYLPGVTLAGAGLSGAKLEGADLRNANLKGANLQGANLRGTDLSNADLSKSNLQGAHLAGANLRGTLLEEASLKGAHLDKANLNGAILRGANLSSADFSGALNLTPEQLSSTLRDKNTRLPQYLGTGVPKF